jgi:hypothetical protein
MNREFGWESYTFASPTMNAKLRRAHDLGFADAMSWEASLRHAGIELTKGEWCRERRERLEAEIHEAARLSRE